MKKPPNKTQTKGQYDCFADRNFLQRLPGLLAKNEERFVLCRQSLQEAERITYNDLLTFVSAAA